MPTSVTARSTSSPDADPNFCAADGSHVAIEPPPAHEPGPVMLCHRPVNIALPGYLTTIADASGSIAITGG